MHSAGQAGQVRVYVAVTRRKRGRESGIEPVVIEHTDERVIEREKSHGQCGGRGRETSLYFAGKRQVSSLPGTNRL